MKNIFTIIIFLSFMGITRSQTIDIPDAVFLEYLIDNGVDTNQDGLIQVLEAAQVNEINIDGGYYPVTNLKGIKEFVNLETLYNYSVLEELDISNMASLRYVDIVSSYESVPGSLTSLNITNLPNLEYLRIIIGDLSGFKISSCPRLETLELYSNETVAVKINNFAELTLVDLHLVGGYGNVEIINCPKLLNVYFEQAPVDTLNLSGNPLLKINLTTLPEFIGYLNLSNCIAYTEMEFGAIQVRNLDISNISNLELLRVEGLKNLEFAGSYNLKNIELFDFEIENLDFSELSKLADITLYNNNTLKNLIIKNGASENLTLFNVDSLKKICTDEEDIIDHQSIVDFENLNAEVTTFCDFANVGKPFVVNGKTLIDINNDSCQTSQQTLPYARYLVSTEDDERYFFGRDDGSINFYLEEDDYTLHPDVDLYEDLFSVAPLSKEVSFPNDGSMVSQDFCLSAIDDIDLIQISIIPLNNARPGFESDYKLVIANNGNVIRDGMVSVEYPSAVLEYLESSQVPESNGMGGLSWGFTELLPYEKHEILFTMKLNTPIDNPPLEGGSILNYSAQITPLGNQDPLLYSGILAQEVVNSFDPNDKTCLQGDELNIDHVGEFLEYMIRFENTGTAAAENIVVTDSIDVNVFDINSLEIIDASFPTNVRIEDNVVSFVFNNINLPFDDSSNDGYVTFKIKTKGGLELGEAIKNNADIFFDFNFPIRTNTTSTIISDISKTKDNLESQQCLIENPVTGFLMLGEELNEFDFIEIFNNNGILISKENLLSGSQHIDVSTISSGLYVVRLSSVNKTFSQKVIIIN